MKLSIRGASARPFTLGLSRHAPALLLALALGLAGACSGSLPPGACNSDADCPTPGEACIQGRCQQVAAVCSGHGDCPLGESCVDGRCQRNEEYCLRDDDCPPGQRCEVLTGRCVTAQCQHDGDCDGDQVCVEGECRDSGERSCIFDPDCNPPSTVCEGGECVDGCLTTGCPAGSDCNTSTGRCEESQTCGVDDDCNPPSTICENNECQPGCTQGSCPLESYCDTRTGRCVPGCTADSHCGPPQQICEGGDCVAGCLSTGCSAGYTCNSTTGRCTPDAGCINDADCSPPSTICEGGDCVGGCLSTGCGFEEHCNQATGRCDSGCVDDADCSPPSTVCVDGSCEAPPDCLNDGCPPDHRCLFETGVCEPAGTTALGYGCADGSGDPVHSTCESDYCAPLQPPPEGPGPICSAPCTTVDQCPSGFGCAGLSPPGASLCLAWSQTTPEGAYCDDHGDCRSLLCHENECRRTCGHARDCLGSHICGLAITNDYLETACMDPVGGGVSGTVCQHFDECRTFLCVDGRCADPCHTSADCETGYVCSFVSNETGAVRACLYADGQATGHAQPGATCDPDTHAPCRSLWCIRLEDGASEGVCIDTCATQEDCPIGMRCAVVVLGEGADAITAPLCLPR